jgi:hypothetical protein
MLPTPTVERERERENKRNGIRSLGDRRPRGKIILSLSRLSLFPTMGNIGLEMFSLFPPVIYI